MDSKRLKKCKRSTSAQVKLLIDYMSKHTDFAMGQGEYSGPIGSIRSTEVWEELQPVLNVHGPDKSIDQWKTTWRDLKARARKECSELIPSVGNICTISESMRKVLTTMGYSIIDDVECAESTKVPKEESCNNENNENNEIDHDPLSSTSSTPKSPAQDSPCPAEPAYEVPSPEPSHRYQRMRRRRRHIPLNGTIGSQELRQQNALLQRLCNLVEEQNSILRERNRIERNRSKRRYFR